MRESNHSIPSQNRASVAISSALYDRRALDATAALPLLNSLTHLVYLTSTSPRIREILTMDGALERLISLLNDFCVSPPPPESPSFIYALLPPSTKGKTTGKKREPVLLPPTWDKQAAYRFSLAFQCVVNVGVRGSEGIRRRVVQAGMVDVVGCVLEGWLAARGEGERRRREEDTTRPNQGSRSSSTTSIASVSSTTSNTSTSTSRPVSTEPEDTDTDTTTTAPTHRRRGTIVAPRPQAIEGLERQRTLRRDDEIISTAASSSTSPRPILLDLSASSSFTSASPSPSDYAHPNPMANPNHRPTTPYEHEQGLVVIQSPSGGDSDAALVVTGSERVVDDFEMGVATPVSGSAGAFDESAMGTPRGEEDIVVPMPLGVEGEVSPSIPEPSTSPSPSRSTTTTPPAIPPAPATAPATAAQPTPTPSTSSSTTTTPSPYREDDILLALQLLAYLSKYPHIRQAFYKTRMGGFHPALASSSSSSSPPRMTNIFSLIERFTSKGNSGGGAASTSANAVAIPAEMQYWAGVIMRNACRKDESRGGIRQCANMLCGKWESYPREFAKCRRCRKAKYCGKECQSTAWSEGHRFWCSAREGDEVEGGAPTSSASASAPTQAGEGGGGGEGGIRIAADDDGEVPQNVPVNVNTDVGEVVVVPRLSPHHHHHQQQQQPAAPPPPAPTAVNYPWAPRIRHARPIVGTGAGGAVEVGRRRAETVTSVTERERERLHQHQHRMRDWQVAAAVVVVDPRRTVSPDDGGSVGVSADHGDGMILG